MTRKSMLAAISTAMLLVHSGSGGVDEPGQPRATEGAKSTFEAILDRLDPKLLPDDPPSAPVNDPWPFGKPETRDIFDVEPDLLGTSSAGWSIWFNGPPEVDIHFVPLISTIEYQARDVSYEAYYPGPGRLDLIATPKPEPPLRLHE